MPRPRHKGCVNLNSLKYKQHLGRRLSCLAAPTVYGLIFNFHSESYTKEIVLSIILHMMMRQF